MKSTEQALVVSLRSLGDIWGMAAKGLRKRWWSPIALVRAQLYLRASEVIIALLDCHAEIVRERAEPS